MTGEEDGDEEIHWVKFGGGDGFLELDGEGGENRQAGVKKMTMVKKTKCS